MTTACVLCDFCGTEEATYHRHDGEVMRHVCNSTDCRDQLPVSYVRLSPSVGAVARKFLAASVGSMR